MSFDVTHSLVPILLPELGSDGQPMRLAQWLVSSGDHVLEGDRVAEVIVGGILFHVASPAEGMVKPLIEAEDTLLDPHAHLGDILVQE